ncbi:uncharacterized protein [Leuresthes tenuis]|uniref:uncharacterized protein n=1 Tax=Leuresthes tenuis TaxID=355514 RepID=UPI003B51171E
MSPSEQGEFYRWYGGVCKGTLNFREQSMLYCKNCVDILFKGCVKFREQFFNETRVDPLKCITIASACMKVFTANFLQPKTLAITSPVDYSQQSKTFSNASIQWLEWLAFSRGIEISHALNTGEKGMGPYHVDGYAEIDSVRVAFEFYGCFFHGCPVCHLPQDACPLRKAPFEQFYAETRERERVLQSVYGLRLHIMWEHEWTEMKKSHPEVIEFLKSFNAPEPLSPRQALYGGRTCALRLRYSAGVDETVHYADFTSLYPYVNCSFPYPLGHPRVICKDFDDPDSYFGFIRAVVYPLFFPVLPYKSSHGKLVFTLCRTCAEMNNQAGACNHSDEERALTGVWVNVEFSKALKLGYRLAKITEVWHFDRTSSSIFVDYIHTFLKGKQETSGYPADALDEESKLRYVRDYKLHQGIQLDTSKIEVNPAKRQVAKLCLNSFWGKFAQRNDLHQTAIVTDPN